MDSHDNNNAQTEATPQEKPKKKNGGFIRQLPRDFFLGCLAFVPLSLLAFITYYFFHLLLSLGRIFFGLTESRQTSAALLALVVIILAYTGRKLRRQEKWFWNILEYGIMKIPVLGGWYSTVRDIVQTFTSGGEKSYLGTVAVPVGKGYIIGFVTKREETEDDVRVTVFVPTSPNPTTGLVFFYSESDIKYLDISAEQAFSRVISLGMKS